MKQNTNERKLINVSQAKINLDVQSRNQPHGLQEFGIIIPKTLTHQRRASELVSPHKPI